VALSTAAAVTVATSTAAAIAAPPELPDEPAPGAKYTFKTVAPSTMSFEKIYYENDVVIATETFDAKGELLGLQGVIKDGSYKEYYDNGNIKTEKTVINAKTSGTLKAYYPNGVLQSEAYYLAGKLNGGVRIYGESGNLMFEQNFKDGIQSGYSREFDDKGALRAEVFYIDGHAAEKPKTEEVKKADMAAAMGAQESMVTAKPKALARGELFTFYLNNKYVAKLTLDNDFNITSQVGKVPDGAVKVYTTDGKLEKEFVFLKNAVTSLKVYDEGGALAGEYTFKKDLAVKK
jgi:antitoxin component YwqK of YwqJK toxin-antitoxin module